MELAFQRTFADLLPAPFDGVGVIANYTFIDSGSDFENEITAAAYGIPGLSENTINFTLFYEKGPFREGLINGRRRASDTRFAIDNPFSRRKVFVRFENGRGNRRSCAHAGRICSNR